MAGIVHKIEEKLGMGGSAEHKKEEQKLEAKKHEEEKKKHESGGVMEKQNSPLHMDTRADSSEALRNKCAACYKQYNRMDHLVEHMRVSFHSNHEPKCGICQKHCRSFESLREHLIGPLPKIECAKVFSVRGCSLCLNIFDTQSALRYHRGVCQMPRSASGLITHMSRISLQSFTDFEVKVQEAKVVALGCKMVGGGSDGTLDLCARVCITDENENVIFHTFIKPLSQVTNYRYETTRIRPEHLRDAMPLRQVQRKIQEFLCNGEPMWKLKPKGGKSKILVGHGLDHDLDCLGVEYRSFLTRDTATYPPLMKTNKLSNSLKYLTETYLGYEIHNGIQDPYEDCVAAMRLYFKMRSQAHRHDSSSGSAEGKNHNHFATWRQKELERMTPNSLLEISTSDYYCWCLDS